MILLGRLLLAVMLLASLGATAMEAPRLSESDILRGSFTQEQHLLGLPSPLISKGQFLFSPRVGLIWQVAEPIAVVTVISHGSAVQRQAGRDPAPLPQMAFPIIDQFQAIARAAVERDRGPLNQTFDVTEERNTSGAWKNTLVPREQMAASLPWLRRIVIMGSQYFDVVEIYKANEELQRIRFSALSLRRDDLSVGERDLLALAGR
jgi:hypothetical protein